MFAHHLSDEEVILGIHRGLNIWQENLFCFVFFWKKGKSFDQTFLKREHRNSQEEYGKIVSAQKIVLTVRWAHPSWDGYYQKEKTCKSQWGCEVKWLTQCQWGWKLVQPRKGQSGGRSELQTEPQAPAVAQLDRNAILISRAICLHSNVYCNTILISKGTEHT